MFSGWGAPQWSRYPRVDDPSLPKGFDCFFDPQTNRKFYCDHNTGTTQWNHPLSYRNTYNPPSANASDGVRIPIKIEGRENRGWDGDKDSVHQNQPQPQATSNSAYGSWYANANQGQPSESGAALQTHKVENAPSPPSPVAAAPRTTTTQHSAHRQPEPSGPPVRPPPPTVAPRPAANTSEPMDSQPADDGEKARVLRGIDEVRVEADSLRAEVERFAGTSKDKQYRYLEEMLMRLLLKLDDMQFPADEVRAQRKRVVKCIQWCQDQLELKALANDGSTTGDSPPRKRSETESAAAAATDEKDGSSAIVGNDNSESTQAEPGEGTGRCEGDADRNGDGHS